MFCRNCGKELEDGSMFCGNCGAKLTQGIYPYNEEPVEMPDQNMENTENTPRKSPVGKIVAGVVIAVLAVCIGVGAFLGIRVNTYQSKYKKLTKNITEYAIDACTDEMNDLAKDWKKTGLLSFKDKQDLLDSLQEVCDSAEESAQWLEDAQKQIKNAIDAKEDYNLLEDYKDYESILDECKAALEAKNIEKGKELLADVDSEFESLKKETKDYVDEKLDEYNGADLTLADADDKSVITDGIKKIKELQQKENYKDMKSLFDDLDEVAYQYLKPKKSLNVQIQQVDASQYPNIRLYLQVEDQKSGEVPASLDNTLFFIRKQDASANYIKQEVKKVSQLNETEALNIEMVADVSGSMKGQPLMEAKNIMSNFVSSVQFAAGDKVELISFSTGVAIEETFSTSSMTLISRINGLQTGNMTSLYDALYASVNRVAAQSGAKCVIAFTDGLDNYSSCSSSDVISTAQRYHVPIFIIGIGTSNYSEASNIAKQTGGAYYNINTVTSMSDIYKEIYKQEKELYLVEFEDTTGSIMDTANILVGYHSALYGGENTYSYTPNVLMSVSGSGLYNDGPEAVVEGYMRGFDDAMTYSDFSYISNYLKVDSPIYNEQIEYVKRNITELLDTYEIVSTVYNGSDECAITTRETYYVQKAGEPLELMTQQCTYRVIRENGSWKMTEFIGDIDIISRVNQ